MRDSVIPRKKGKKRHNSIIKGIEKNEHINKYI